MGEQNTDRRMMTSTGKRRTAAPIPRPARIIDVNLAFRMAEPQKLGRDDRDRVPPVVDASHIGMRINVVDKCLVSHLQRKEESVQPGRMEWMGRGRTRGMPRPTVLNVVVLGRCKGR